MSSNNIQPRPGVETARDSTDRFLVILIDGDRYGLAQGQVREIVRAVWITPLPGAPAVVMGVIDVRGRFVPVIDMRRRFGRISPPLSPSERFVLAWTGEREIAIRADEVAWFSDVDAATTEPVPDVVRRESTVSGLAHTADGLLLIQDLAGFLSEAESSAVETALAAFSASPAR